MSMAYQFTKKSQSSRSAILQKLKKQVEGADYDKLPEEKTFHYPVKTIDEQLARFVELLKANHAEVINVTKSTIGPTIQDALNQRGIEKLLYGKNTDYSSLLETELNPQKNIELIPFDFNLNENKAFVFNDLPASFTSSKFAIADTGTVVLWPSIEEPRTMSLIPPLHIVAVQTKSLYQNFANLVEAQNWKAQMPTNILLVSGPSKTADIQQTLAYGAHGPKELIVLLIED